MAAAAQVNLGCLIRIPLRLNIYSRARERERESGLLLVVAGEQERAYVYVTALLSFTVRDRARTVGIGEPLRAAYGSKCSGYLIAFCGSVSSTGQLDDDHWQLV